MTIWYIVCSFGTFCPVFGIVYQEKSGSPASTRNCTRKNSFFVFLFRSYLFVADWFCRNSIKGCQKHLHNKKPICMFYKPAAGGTNPLFFVCCKNARLSSHSVSALITPRPGRHVNSVSSIWPRWRKGFNETVLNPLQPSMSKMFEQSPIPGKGIQDGKGRGRGTV
jgi:hypothetical protein